MSQTPPIPPTPIDPHDDDVTDDSLNRPITAPPERDRVQARLGDQEPTDDLPPRVADEVAAKATAGLPMLPLLLVAIVVIIFLVWWLA